MKFIKYLILFIIILINNINCINIKNNSNNSNNSNNNSNQNINDNSLNKNNNNSNIIDTNDTFNNINSNLNSFSSGGSDIIYEIFISELNGQDTPTCGTSTNNINNSNNSNNTVMPCKSILGAVQSFNNSVLNNLEKSQFTIYPHVNFILYPGQYYGQSIQLYRFNATITSIQNQTSPVYFNLNNQYPFFEIKPINSNNNNGGSGGSGEYYPSDLTIDSIVISCSGGHSQSGSLVQVDASQKVPIQVTLNQLLLSSNNINESLIMVSGTYGDEDNASQDWTNNVDKDYYSVDPYVVINLYNSNFSNSIAYSSIVLSSYAPITLRVGSCIFSNFQNINYTFFMSRGIMEITNLTLVNVGVSYKPFFSAHNSLVTFQNSNIQSYMASTSFFQLVGCFVYVANSNISIQYNNFDETIDYAIFYLDISSGSFLSNNITFFGRNTQLHDQGSINIMSSQVGFRLNHLYSNISSLIFSEGSNVFSFLNDIEIENTSAYHYFQCSTDQQSSIISGDSFSVDSFNNKDNNCAKYIKKQEKNSFITVFFIGFGSGVGLIFLIGIFAIIYKKYSQTQYKRLLFEINN